MTTIAWDGKTLYADSLITRDEMKSLGRKAVRIRSPEGPLLVALAGEIARLPAICSSLADGDDPLGLVGAESTCLVVSRAGARVLSDGQTWRDADVPLFFGTGAPYAAGAYAATGSVEQAVKAAVATDLYSGGPIRKLRL